MAAALSYCLFFCAMFIGTQSSDSSAEEPADMAIIEEIDVKQDNTAVGEMPESFGFNLQLIHGRTPMRINLTKNDMKNERQKIAVIRKNLNGKTYLATETVPFPNNVAMYQDSDSIGTFTVTCEGFESGDCDPVLLGSVNVDGAEYEFQPMDENPAGRMKRSIKTKRKRLYAAYRKKNTISRNDYDKKDVVKNKDWSRKKSQTFKTRQRTASFNSKSLTSSKSRAARKQVDRTIETDRHNGAANNYFLSLVVVVDYSIYMKWYNASKETSERLRDLDAKSKIRMYFAHVINGIDLRFRNIREHDFSVKVVVSEYVIADNPEFSIWTNTYISTKPPYYVSVMESLNKLVDWRKFHQHSLPEHDHIMLFTGENLYEERTKDPSVTGYAHVKTVCTEKSASVNEELGGFGGIITATHELGHSLGANHDGEWNPCMASDQYIMTALGGDINPSNQLNPWKFSDCSIQYFRDYIDELNNKGINCMLDDPVQLHAKEFQEHIKVHPGQKFSPNAQCKQLVGRPSYYGWGGGLGEFREICTNMACKNVSTKDNFILFNAARGTSCGDKRWCINGECVWNDKAPAKDDTCVHGDSLKPINNSNCRELIKENSARCYSKEYQSFCCGSCKKHYTGRKDCEFGDKVTSCVLIRTKPYLCYDKKNRGLCCKSCHDKKSTKQGCEYGDRKSDCNVNLCHQPQHKINCCKTCSPENIRKTRTTPAPPVTPKPTPKPKPKPKPTTKRPNNKPRQTSRSWLRRTTSLIPFSSTRHFTLTVAQKPSRETRPNPPTTNRNRNPFTRPNNFSLQPGRDLIPDPFAPGWCVDPNAFYRPDVPCEFLSKWLSLCTDSTFKQTCCQRCNVDRNFQIKIECVDSPKCMAKRGADCYNKTILDDCCSTCSVYETGFRLCPYGDKDARCPRMVRHFPQYYCENYADTCCESCYRVPERRDRARSNGFQRPFAARAQERTAQRTSTSRQTTAENNIETKAVSTAPLLTTPKVQEKPKPRLTYRQRIRKNKIKSKTKSILGAAKRNIKRRIRRMKKLFDNINSFLTG